MELKVRTHRTEAAIRLWQWQCAWAAARRDYNVHYDDACDSSTSGAGTVPPRQERWVLAQTLPLTLQNATNGAGPLAVGHCT